MKHKRLGAKYKTPLQGLDDGEIIGGWLYRLHALSALGVEELSKIALNIIIAMIMVMVMVKVVMMITTI